MLQRRKSYLVPSDPVIPTIFVVTLNTDVAPPDPEGDEGVDPDLRLCRPARDAGALHEADEGRAALRRGKVHGHLHVPGHRLLRRVGVLPLEQRRYAGCRTT